MVFTTHALELFFRAIAGVYWFEELARLRVSPSPFSPARARAPDVLVARARGTFTVSALDAVGHTAPATLVVVQP